MNLYDRLLNAAAEDDKLAASYLRQGLPVKRCLCGRIMTVSGVPGGWILRCLLCDTLEAYGE